MPTKAQRFKDQGHVRKLRDCLKASKDSRLLMPDSDPDSILQASI